MTIENYEFWEWVIMRKAHQNPRGDFIRDTRSVINAGNDPNAALDGAYGPARDEHDKLWKRWNKIK